jgi:short subunit dehydrogenase-like uncharacterized protein
MHLQKSAVLQKKSLDHNIISTHRILAMSNRNQAELDVIVWGATGFTGGLACAYLSQDACKFFSFALRQDPSMQHVKWGVAGRNRSKMQAVLDDCGAPKNTPILVVEADDEKAIEEMVSKSRVIISCAGPFVRYSDKVVEACAKSGCHYVDICGEPVWVRSCVDRFQDRAQAAGACIVNFCGYDSIPSDLGCYFAVQALRNKLGDPDASVRSVKCYQIMFTGGGAGFSGGSLQTGLVSKSNPKLQLTTGVNPDSPFLLGGEPACGMRDIDMFQTEASFSHDIGCWVAPFPMERINAVATRRSAANLSFGPNFNYQEVVVAPSQKAATKAAKRTTNPIPPEKIKEMIDQGRLPKPGEGPPSKHRANSVFLTLLVAEADNDENARVCVAVRGGESGYEETAKMVVESALALALQPADCPGYTAAGFQSTAMCMGPVLIQRLNNAGIQFYVVEDPQTEVMRFWQGCKEKMSASKARL